MRTAIITSALAFAAGAGIGLAVQAYLRSQEKHYISAGISRLEEMLGASA